MIDQLLKIDVSKLKYDSREGDIIKIQLRSNDVIEVNYSKLVIQSKYIRDKYKYSEALNMMQNEINEISEQKNISPESIKYFIQLIQEEKVNIPIEHYRNLYILSETFDIPTFIKELDTIGQEKLFNDLNFTIQNLQDFMRTNENQETKFTSKIEKFLSVRINECIINTKFDKLPITSISRILEKSDKEKIDHNLLVDFIVKSIDTHFILLRFVKLEKVLDDKIDDLFNIFDSQEEQQREIYLEYLPFSLLFFKKMKNKYNRILKEIDEKEEELEQTKIQLDQKEEEQEKTKEELKQAKIQLKQKEEELEQTKIQLKQKEEEQRSLSIVIVEGDNEYNQLGENLNKNERSISIPQKFQLYSSPLLSFSGYENHSVIVTSDGLLKGIGYNNDGRISATLQKKIINHFTDFCINDHNGRKLDPISAVCSLYSTLYMFSKINESGRQLVLCDKDINGGKPVFLEIGNHQPVALFGGRYNSAAIGLEGEIIFINRYSVKKAPDSLIESVYLPDEEKASSIACCNDLIIVLSSKGRVFKSPIESGSSILRFSEVDELKGKKIICLSGTYNHILAVSEEGHAFGCGSNEYGKLGLGKKISSVSSFKEISSLGKYEIKAAYAGGFHSLLQT